MKLFYKDQVCYYHGNIDLDPATNLLMLGAVVLPIWNIGTGFGTKVGDLRTALVGVQVLLILSILVISCHHWWRRDFFCGITKGIIESNLLSKGTVFASTIVSQATWAERYFW